MLVYMYSITKLDDGYDYQKSITDSNTFSDSELMVHSFKWDRPIHIDIPEQNKMVFLFNSELARDSFELGLHIEHNLAKELDRYKSALPEGVSVIRFFNSY